MTSLIHISSDRINKQAIAHASSFIKKGGIVAFPTETVYGLGADAFNARAVRKIFRAKGRPSDNPLIVHIAEYRQLRDVAKEIPRLARTLAKKFWPGPLTLVLKKQRRIPKEVTAGLDSVAVRMPQHPVALALIKAAKTPLAAPSANLSGKPSPTTAAHVIHDLTGKVDAIIDGGKCKVGVESTILDLTVHPPLLLRPGGITIEQIERVLKKPIDVHSVVTHASKKVSFAQAPGMKYRHYAPHAKLLLIEGQPQRVIQKMRTLARMHKKKHKRVGILSHTLLSDFPADEILYIGKTQKQIARNLFAAFRALDKKEIDIIIAEGIPEAHIGLAVMNRLRKAASTIIRV